MRVEWNDVLGMGMDVYMLTNGGAGNSTLQYIGNQWFCSAGHRVVMVLLFGTVV